jgi:hypothetical protein
MRSQFPIHQYTRWKLYRNRYGDLQIHPAHRNLQFNGAVDHSSRTVVVDRRLSTLFDPNDDQRSGVSALDFLDLTDAA